MSFQNASDDGFVDDARGIFDGGPPSRCAEAIGLARPGEQHTLSRVAFCVLVGWVPLAVITTLQTAMLGDDSLASFASDIAVHVRLLLVVPLLVAAEAIVLPRLSAIADEFVNSGMIRGGALCRFADARASTVALRDSAVAEMIVVALAFATAIAAAQFVPFFSYPKWQVGQGPEALFRSFAGWWHICASIPLLLILLFAWFWRLFLWARLLVVTSVLDLHLIPSHPDRMGGLHFVGYSVQAFCVLGFAFGAAAAGMAANQVARPGVSLLELQYVALAVVAFTIILFCAPLLTYLGKLLRSRRDGIHAYGALARELGERFEGKWLARRPDASALEAPDFSATTDLFAITANVYAMRLIPVSLTNVALLAAATLLPFLPVMLMTLSLDQLLQRLGALLF